MKLEIYKLQVTQYGHSEVDNTDNKSDFSINTNPVSKTNITEENRPKPPSSGFQLPDPMNKSRMRSPGSSGNLSEKLPKYNLS